MENDEGCVKLLLGNFLDELIKDKNAFILLSVVALRAKTKSGLEPHKGKLIFLDSDECFIEDHYNFSLTESEYITAKKHLTKLQYVEFKTIYKGTIAKLINNSIFDIN